MPTKAEGFFAQALLAMQKADNPWTDPIQFQEYRKGFQGADLKAPPLISVQNFAGLNKDLKSAGAMVLRLGGAGGLTEFRLIKAQISLKDEFFLNDSECFALDPALPHLTTPEILRPFELMGSIEESGAVNLALASGLLGRALDLDDGFPRVAPAKAASTFTFDFQPFESIPVSFTHLNGQVEIDSIFLARRKGRLKLVVIEAKHGRPGAGLAKHKLAYPAYAVRAKSLPEEIEIVPVYLRSWQTEGQVNFGVCECSFTDKKNWSLTSLQPLGCANIYAIGFGMS